MISCYLLSLISFVMLLVAMIQHYGQFMILQANEVTFIILTSIVYLFTETLIIFFFVGTGVSVKEYTQEHNLPPAFHQKSIAIKRKVYPPQLLNILLMMVLFILVGAVDTGRMSPWIYRIFFAICLWHFLKAKRIQHACFKENTANILAMSGIERNA